MLLRPFLVLGFSLLTFTYAGSDFSLQFRLANLGDSEQITKLVEEGWMQPAQNGVKAWDHSHNNVIAAIKAYLTMSNHYIFIAEHEGDLVGLIAIAGHHPFLFPNLTYKVASILVDKRYRRQGVGRSLMEHIEIFVKENGGDMIDLTASPMRAKHGTHSFFESQGYGNSGAIETTYFRKRV
jgi:GNAT superfamily N-acetyltransferase